MTKLKLDALNNEYLRIGIACAKLDRALSEHPDTTIHIKDGQIFIGDEGLYVAGSPGVPLDAWCIDWATSHVIALSP